MWLVKRCRLLLVARLHGRHAEQPSRLGDVGDPSE
jgi:hypothetical protein